MSDYETLKVSDTHKFYFSEDECYGDDDEFKIFNLVLCPNCPNPLLQTTNDGNRNQKCLSCNTVLMKDGKMVAQENKKEKK